MKRIAVDDWNGDYLDAENKYIRCLNFHPDLKVEL